MRRPIQAFSAHQGIVRIVRASASLPLSGAEPLFIPNPLIS
jgi:hypothetical protein